MTIEVESAHLVVHLSQRSALYGVNLRKKLWKCSQRSLKEDNPLGGVLFLQIQSLDILYLNVPWSCRPYRYSNVITCTDSTVEHTEDEGLGANILVLRCVRWQKLELSCRTSIREKFSQVNCSASNCLTSRSSKKKKEKKDRQRGKWDIRVRFPSSDEESIESFLDDETACDDDHFIFGTRDSLSPRKIFTALEEVFVSTANCVQVTFRNFPCYGSKGISVTFFLFYALVDIVIRFLDPDLSLIIYLSVIEVKTEGNRHRD